MKTADVPQSLRPTSLKLGIKELSEIPDEAVNYRAKERSHKRKLRELIIQKDVGGP